MAPGVRGRATAVLAGIVAVAAACGGSGVQYIENQDAGFFLKFPDRWARFDIEESPRPDDVTPDAWHVFMDANDQPTEDHAASAQHDEPIALVEIRPLRGNERQQISLVYLRSMVMNGQADPVQLALTEEQGIELVSYEEVTQDAGYWGSSIVVTLPEGEGEVITIGQRAMVDPELTTLYRLLVACRAECYDDNRQEIDDVFSSWTIEEH
jgi:hypothetical protein